LIIFICFCFCYIHIYVISVLSRLFPGGVVTYKKHAWTQISDKVLSGQGKTAYKTYKKAMIACAKNAKCKGVNKSGDKYYVATGGHLTTSSGKATYVKGEDYTPYFTYDSELTI